MRLQSNFHVFYPLNSRFCFKETPPTTGQNLDIFYSHYPESGKLFPKKSFSNAYTVWKLNAHIYSKCASIFCANWTVSNVKDVYCSTEFSWKKVADFPDEVRVKTKPDFVQPLMVFHFSNICYCKKYLELLISSTE